MIFLSLTELRVQLTLFFIIPPQSHLISRLSTDLCISFVLSFDLYVIADILIAQKEQGIRGRDYGLKPHSASHSTPPAHFWVSLAC